MVWVPPQQMAVVTVKFVQMKPVPVLFRAKEQPWPLRQGSRLIHQSKLAARGRCWDAVFWTHTRKACISLRHSVPFPLTYPFCRSSWSPADVHAHNHVIHCEPPYSLPVTWFLLKNPPHPAHPPFQQTILPQIKSFYSPQ